MTRDALLYVVLPSVLLGIAVRFAPMSILDRYVLRKFSSLFAISLALQVSLILLVRLGDKELSDMFDGSRTLREGILIFLYHAPVRILEVVPAAGILGAFFTIGSLTRSNELTAIRASGISLYRITVPILIFSFLCCFVTLAFVDRIVAPSAHRANLLDSDRPYEQDREIVFREPHGGLAFIQAIDAPRRLARHLTFYEFEGNRLVREVYAPTAGWSDAAWTLRNGWIRDYAADGVRFERFKELDRPLIADPRILITTANAPETMTFQQLNRVIAFKRQAGQSVRREIVRFHHNIAYPFALFVGVMLSLPLSLLFGRHAVAIGFPATMLLSFLYWGLAIATFEAMGENGRIPAAIAPWAANALFAGVGVVLARSIRR